MTGGRWFESNTRNKLTHIQPDKQLTMDRIALIKVVAATFRSNPEAKEFHVTKDAQCFLLERDAVEHGKHLGPHANSVELITREGALDFDPNAEKTKEQHKREREAKIAADKQAAEDAKVNKEPAATSTGGTTSGTDAADGGTDDGGESGDTDAASRTEVPAKVAPKKAAKKAAKKTPKRK